MTIDGSLPENPVRAVRCSVASTGQVATPCRPSNAVAEAVPEVNGTDSVPVRPLKATSVGA